MSAATTRTTRRQPNKVGTAAADYSLFRSALASVTDCDDDNNIENINTMNRSKAVVATKPRTTKRRPIVKAAVSPDSTDSNSTDDSDDAVVSPPKLRKFTIQIESTLNPVVLLDRLSLASPTSQQSTNQVAKINKFQNARKTLNSAETYSLPGREKEIQELSDFLDSALSDRKSASMYISGQPGTGKTACLSKLLNASKFTNQFKRVYVNCTSIPSAAGIYKKVCAELGIKAGSEKECLANIEKYLKRKHQTILMVLDEIDQLVGRKQSVLYTIFEWPALTNSNMLLIGIANSLDLTDRLLSRLHAKCDLKPRLMHFAPYSKQQITDIFKARLADAQVLDLFPAVTIQLLAAKVASVSGDVRRALDIGRRVIEMAEEQKRGTKQLDLDALGIGELNAPPEQVEVKQVMRVLQQVYGAAQTLGDDLEDTFPLQQKILICTILMILKRDKNKDITVGRLYGVYAKVCAGRNIPAVGQNEFAGLCELVETRGILRIIKNKEPRLSKVQLQWDEAEVTASLQDKQLIASILADTSCITK